MYTRRNLFLEVFSASRLFYYEFNTYKKKGNFFIVEEPSNLILIY